MAVKDVNQIFDSTIADRMQDNEENSGEILECLYDLGILEQSILLWEYTSDMFSYLSERCKYLARTGSRKLDNGYQRCYN